jgi:putative glutamine amidotransferase
MSGKPWVGINGDFRAAKQDAGALSWFNTGYYDSVAACGGLPVLIPPMAEDDDLKQLLKKLDGLVLSGCTYDLDPGRLGLQAHPTSRPMPQRREDFDRRLCQLAVDMRIPMLAIGSGMQTLNVVCGGSLFAHVPEDVPKSILHRDSVETTLRHVLEIEPGSRVDSIYGPGEIRVNSQHHMSIDEPADGFVVSARTPDGVIEAIEADDERWFCMGVQWHPENTTASALDMQIFESLLDAAAGSPAVVPFKRKAA